MSVQISAAVGQHFLVGFPGLELSADTRRLLHTVGPAGAVLFARNIGSPEQLNALQAALHHALPQPPLLAIDQENGRVNRLRNLVGDLPGIAALKRDDKPERAEEFGRAIGRQLAALRINLNFAPVLDLELFAAGTENALRDRCWGTNADEVIRWAGAFARGMQAEGVAACAKHFPGLGGARLDSHEQLPTISRTREQLLNEDLRAFAVLLPRLGAVMVGHAHYPALDGERPRPSSLSPAIMTGLLRGQLEFRGLALTDDREMGAVAQAAAVGEAAVEAFRAGADLLLVCHTAERILSAHEALVKACESGRITTERFAESQQRIQAFRKRWIGPAQI